MRLARLLTVVSVVALVCGCAFAIIGGLIGYAVPSSLNLMLGVRRAAATQAQDAAPEQTGQQYQVGLDVAPQRSMARQGAALGGALGLGLGILLGVLTGVIDQGILVLRGSGKSSTSNRAGP